MHRSPPQSSLSQKVVFLFHLSSGSRTWDGKKEREKWSKGRERSSLNREGGGGRKAQSKLTNLFVSSLRSSPACLTVRRPRKVSSSSFDLSHEREREEKAVLSSLSAPSEDDASRSNPTYPGSRPPFSFPILFYIAKLFEAQLGRFLMFSRPSPASRQRAENLLRNPTTLPLLFDSSPLVFPTTRKKDELGLFPSLNHLRRSNSNSSGPSRRGIPGYQGRSGDGSRKKKRGEVKREDASKSARSLARRDLGLEENSRSVA